MPNRLAHEPSPYLQQHKDNPVDWWPWGPEALEEARRLDRPLLVSIGYSSCHWCHVMAHESFEDPAIAALMNERFINVKVDREERPDVDAIFMTAVQAMTGHGGWPLNVFATPDGVPFFGGTYWPPVDARGMPGFPRVLETIARAWREDREQLLENASRVASFLEDSSRARPAGALDADTGATALARLAESFDETWGGFGSAPKFPQAPTLEFLARHYQVGGSPDARRMLTVTLDRMATGGIYDHLAGGFARYAVDRQWIVPHFEKMLYDNAQLMRVYLETWKATGEPGYAHVVLGTGTWLLEEMRLPGGGFASALDADSEGEEGRFYVWTDAEIGEVLPPDHAAVIRQRFGITPEGNFEGANVLTVHASIEEIAETTRRPAEEVVTLLETAMGILLDHRARRVRPGRDDKMVTSWNGLAISALAQAGAVLRVPGFLEAAQAAARFVLDTARQPDGTLWRTVTGDEPRGGGVLEDYVFVAEGLIHLHQADGDPRWLESAERLMEVAIRDFSREGGVDFFDAPATGTGLTVRAHNLQDNATPSGNAVAADVLLTLGALTDRHDLTERAAALVGSVADLLTEHPAAFGRWLAVAERLARPTYTLVIGGDRSSEAHRELTAAALTYPAPGMVIGHATPGMDAAMLERFPVFRDRTGHDGGSAAWLCRETTCMLPATTIAELSERLQAMALELASVG